MNRLMHSGRFVLVVGGIVAGLLAMLTLWFPDSNDTGIDAADRKMYSLPWQGLGPFYPSEWRTTDQKLVDWRGIPSATYCGECHRKEYEEWSTSIHAVTGLDAVYEGAILENEFASEHGGELATEKIRWCDGCHEPLGILTGGGTPITSVGPNEAIEEGATCILCHTVTDADPLAGNAALTLSINEIPRYIDPALIMAAPEAHARSMQAKKHNPLMGQSAMCGACHTEIRPTEVNGEFPMHFQETYNEWRQSPYATKGIECQNCHMDDDPAGYVAALKRGEQPKRTVSHRFVGNNYLLTDTTLPDNKVVELRGGWVPGRNTLQTDQDWLDSLTRQRRKTLALLQEAADINVDRAYIDENGKAHLSVSITNSGAGHDLPTGALDQRHMWLEVKAIDASGQTVYHNGWFDQATGNIDPDAVVYIKEMQDSQGKLIDRHILFDVASMGYRRKPIAALATDTLDYEFSISEPLSRPYSVEVTLWYRLALQPILENIERQIVPKIDLNGFVIPAVVLQSTQAEFSKQAHRLSER